MAYSSVEHKPWDDDEKCYSSGSCSDDSPILSYRYDKSRHPELEELIEKRERRSAFSIVAKFSIFCTAVILFCVLMYIPLYTKANYQVHQGIVEGWSMDANRDTKIYVLPNNVTIIHEPKNVCNEQNGKKNKLFLLIIVCSATTHFAEREAIRNTWGSYENYKKTSKVFHLVRERYKDYNFTYDLFPNAAEAKNLNKDINSTSKVAIVGSKLKRDVNTNNVASVENYETKRDISSYKNLLPELAKALHSNLKTVKTDLVDAQRESTDEKRYDDENEEKRFDDTDDTVLPGFDMNKDMKEDKEHEDNVYDEDEESNVMKIPSVDYREQEDNTQTLTKILTMLKQSNFPETVQNVATLTTGSESRNIDHLLKDSNVPETVDNLAIVTKEPGNTEPEFKLVFLLGLPAHDNNSEIQSRIDAEAATYGDIIQESFIDTYNNLTIKSVMMLKFVTNKCNNSVRYILKTDDDNYINAPNLMLDLKNRSAAFDRRHGAEHPGAERLLIGDVMCSARPVQDVNNKWYSPRYMYSGRVYPCYASGVAYAFSADTARALYAAALKTPLFHLEDVYITGMCPLMASPRIKPVYDPLFSYFHYGLLRDTEQTICAVHSLATCHRISAAGMPVMYRAMNSVRWVDKCERKRLTKIFHSQAGFHKYFIKLIIFTTVILSLILVVIHLLAKHYWYCSPKRVLNR